MEFRSRSGSRHTSHSLRHSPANDAARARQRRASAAGSRSRARSARRGGSHTDSPRDEQRTPAGRGRADLPGADPRRRATASASFTLAPVLSILPSRRTERCSSSASGSTTCHWRLNWPQPARPPLARAAPRAARRRLDVLTGERDADPRQQTLRATIAWSHDLLSTDEQQAFARLSVFAGGCTLRGRRGDLRERPRHVQSLLDKSLIRRREAESEPRLWMLETIREFAAEQLAASGEAERIARRHLALLPRPCRGGRRARQGGEYESGGSKRSARIFVAPSIPRSRWTPSRHSIWQGGLASTGTGEVSIGKGGRGSRRLSPRLPLLKPPLAFAHSPKPAISLFSRRM